MSRRILLALAVLPACAGEDLPTDCGDPSMAIVTFPARGSTRDDVRWCVDIHAASRVDASDASAGLDESYAVSRPGVYPWTNLTFADASAACGRAGKFLCDYDVLKLITPAKVVLDRLVYDDTVIEAVPRNGPETSVAHRLDAVNPYDMIITLQTGRPPFPESTRSVAWWATAPEKDDDHVDETQPFVVGVIAGKSAIGGNLKTGAVPKPDYRHPLLGFRCCVNAKAKPAFIALGDDPRRRRTAPDTEVPLAPR